MLKLFGRTAGVRAGQNGGQRNRQGGDMSQCVEIRRACAAAHSQPFLACGFEAGIIPLTLRPQGVSPLEIETAAVNEKSVIVWNGLVFRAAPVLLAVVPVFVVARANTGFGLAEGTAVFLAGTPIVGGLAILVQASPASQTGLPAGSGHTSNCIANALRERRIETGIGRGKENVIDAAGFSEMG